MGLVTQGRNFLLEVPVLITNLTGADLAIGQVAALDITASNAASQIGGVGSPDLMVGNAVAVAAGNIRGWLCCAKQVIKANATGLAVHKGCCKVMVDGSGTNIAAGDSLKPTAASAVLTQLAATQLVVPCAKAFAAATTANALIDGYFDGETWRCERAAS